MSIQMVGWVLDQTIPDPGMKLVLISLANAHNNRSSQCNPGLDVLAHEASLSRSTVLRKLKALVDGGWIKVAASFDESGRQTSNAYTIIQGGEGVRVTPPIIDTPEGVIAVEPPRVSTVTPTIEPEEEPEKRTSPNPQGGEEGKGFQRIWEAWPVDQLPDNQEYARKHFHKLSDEEREACEKNIGLYRTICSQRSQSPRMLTYIKSKIFVLLIDPPETFPDDGAWKITPERPEWKEWLGVMRKKHGPKGVEYFVKLGFIRTDTRWPEGHPNGQAF